MLVPDPPWSSPSCYDSRESYETSNIWTVDSFPWFPTIGCMLGCTRIEGEVVGDTFHGWHDPSGYNDSLGLTNVTQGGQPREDLTIGFSVFNPKRICSIVHLKGQRVSITTHDSGSFEDVGLRGCCAIALRNTEGQLLWAQLWGSLDEHGAEVLPELRIARMSSASPVKEHACYSVGSETATVHQQAARVMLSSLSESRVFDENSALQSIAIGCVEYLVVLQAVDVVAMNGCRDSQYVFTMSIIRRALLEPGPGCTP